MARTLDGNHVAEVSQFQSFATETGSETTVSIQGGSLPATVKRNESNSNHSRVEPKRLHRPES